MRKLVSKAVIGGAFFCFGSAAAAQPDPAALRVIQRSEAASAELPPVGPGNRDWMAAHFINVGQGAATLLEFSCGLALIDTGGQETGSINWPQRLIDYLNGVFERRPELRRTIDIVILTHPHLDHTLGVPAVIAPANRIRILNVVTNAQPNGSGIRGQKDLLEHAADGGIPRTQVTTAMIRSSRGLRNSVIDPLNCNRGAPDIRVLWGSVVGTQAWRSNGNNHSVVVRVGFGESSFLITGDLADGSHATFRQRYAANPQTLNVDVYSPGHHGARDGTTRGLVRDITPELAVISAGNPSEEGLDASAWDYGHPNAQSLGLLTDETTGVTFTRPTRRVAVGLRGRPFDNSTPPEWEWRNMTRAIFSTGWDGNVVVFAHTSGEKRILID